MKHLFEALGAAISLISRSERQMDVNVCFSRACCVSSTQVTLLFRLKNTHISHVELLAVMSFERSAIFHSAGDDPGPFLPERSNCLSTLAKANGKGFLYWL